MIDFRYHLVSLASVLIALGIGIVLGAGPLKEGISESLEDQVAQLRTEKEDLRTELDATATQNQTHEQFEQSTLPALVSGWLADRTVAVVTFPGAESGLITTTEDTLGAAGATMTGPIQVEEAWTDTDADAVALRDAVAADLSVQLKLTEEGAAPVSLDAVLGAVILDLRVTEGAQPGPPAPTVEERRAAWERLQGEGLVTGDFPEERATLAVAIGAPQSAAPTETGSGDPLAEYAALAQVLDTAGDGTVIVAAIDPAIEDTESVISAARAVSAIRQRVSTVDNAGSPMGQAGVVLALLEQDAGGAGQYGLADGAGSVFPDAG